MIDEIANENGFDPSLIKKKKKKKEFDLDAAPGLNDDSKQNTVKNGEISNKPHKSVHFENIEGKKKKKKKPYNFDEMNEALSKDEVCPVANEVPAEPEDDINLDMDFSMTKKKKKNKKKEIDDLIADKKGGTDKFDKDNADEENSLWHNTDREYTYEELLERAFKIMREKNPELTSGRKPKFVIRPPQVLRVGTKKTSFANFMDIARTLHRMPKHLLGFLLAELGTSGSMDGNQQLIIKGRFQAKEIENVLRRYIKEYVTCHTCRSPETILQKDTRLFFLQCESCGSRCSKH